MPMGTQEKPSSLENAVFYVGLLVFMGLVGYLVFQIFSNDALPADLTVHFERLPEEKCGFEVRVFNKGETTAEAIDIVMDLEQSGEKVGEIEAQIDYLPIQSERRLRVKFENTNGRCDSLVLSSVVFMEP